MALEMVVRHREPVAEVPVALLVLHFTTSQLPSSDSKLAETCRQYGISTRPPSSRTLYEWVNRRRVGQLFGVFM